MTWVTLDDTAHSHEKQLAAGALACWFWVCGLSYCYRKESKDGFIPDAVVKLLYPRLGVKEAKRLVEVGLWERTDGGYLIHDYLHWRARRFGGLQAERGAKGGSVSSEAKRQAALDREAGKRVARAESTSTDHKPEPQAETTSTEHNSPQARASVRSGLGADRSGSPEGVQGEPADQDPGRETACPLDLLSRLEKAGTVTSLAEKLVAPIESIRHEIGQFVAYWTIGKGAGQKRTNWAGKARQWVVDKHGKGELRPPGFVAHAGRTDRGAPESPPVPSPMLAMVVRRDQ